MRRGPIAVLAVLTAAALAACSVSVRGLASPAGEASSAPSSSPAHSSLPGGAQTSCLVADDCGADPSVTPADLVCAPLGAAMQSFDAAAGALFPGGAIPRTGADTTLSPARDLVIEVVDRCGFQVMVDVADQYPDPLSSWLVGTAISALGEISALPGGLRCADLKALGLGPKQAVDYWFLWGGPALMDADSDGIPCETVWPDVAQYMPSNR